MRWIENFDLFLLDLDGLLVDTERLHFQAYQTLCHERNCELPWNFLEYLGIAHFSHNGLERALLPLLGGGDWSTHYRRKKEIYQNFLSSRELRLMPGVLGFIEALAVERKKRCVVTHSSRQQVKKIKDQLPILKTIPTWFTREDYENPKPSPDGYIKALEILNDRGDRAVGFEDSLRGIQSLKRTFAMPVLVCDSHHPQMGSEDLIGIPHFSSFNQIPNAFQIAGENSLSSPSS